MKFVFYSLVITLLLTFFTYINAQETDPILNTNVLVLKKEDTKIFRNSDGSFELFIRKIDGRESILLTDTSKDPNGMGDNYSLRAYDPHPTYNGQKRILDGKEITRNPPLYFLVTSTYGPIKGLDPNTQWFHLHLPSAVMFGYPWGREGQFDIDMGTWFNIRVFSKPYADYSSFYYDNAFTISAKIIKPQYPELEKPLSDVANATNGKFIKITHEDQIMDQIQEILSLYRNTNLDIAIVLDTTLSMKQSLSLLKAKLMQYLQTEANNNSAYSYQYGIVLYRDYHPDEYLTKISPLSKDFSTFKTFLDNSNVAGGYDTPEAVYEGMSVALTDLAWSTNNKHIIIQIGDAPPHAVAKGKITKDVVINQARIKDVAIYSISIINSKKVQ